MKTVFEASNSVEAHMMLNLLQSEGVNGRVGGEFLQGGVGELQAIGIVSVLVEDGDYESAARVIAKWESSQPVIEESTDAGPRRFDVPAFCVGVVSGVCVSLLCYYILVAIGRLL